MAVKDLVSQRSVCQSFRHIIDLDHQLRNKYEALRLIYKINKFIEKSNNINLKIDLFLKLSIKSSIVDKELSYSILTNCIRLIDLVEDKDKNIKFIIQLGKNMMECGFLEESKNLFVKSMSLINSIENQVWKKSLILDLLKHLAGVDFPISFTLIEEFGDQNDKLKCLIYIYKHQKLQKKQEESEQTLSRLMSLFSEINNCYMKVHDLFDIASEFSKDNCLTDLLTQMVMVSRSINDFYERASAHCLIASKMIGFGLVEESLKLSEEIEDRYKMFLSISKIAENLITVDKTKSKESMEKLPRPYLDSQSIGQGELKQKQPSSG